MTTLASPFDQPPADAAVAADLACPLCGYNLRGLTKPRCPECGFAFTWRELLDEQADRHRYLFEHHRTRRSFVATWVRTGLPSRFWREVSPANPVHVGRLLLYWLAGFLPLLALGGAVVVPDAVHTNRDLRGSRAMYRPVPGQPGLYAVSRYGPAYTAAELEALLPPPLSVAFVRRVFAFHPWQRDAAWFAPAAMAVLWPAASAAALLLFQASLRKAKVRAVHVLRVAVYGCDFGLLLTAVIATAAPFGKSVPTPFGLPSGSGVDYQVAGALLVAAATCAAVATVRMTFAYAQYLRFDRPLMTVLSAQAIVFLLTCVMLVRAAWVFL